MPRPGLAQFGRCGRRVTLSANERRRHRHPRGPTSAWAAGPAPPRSCVHRLAVMPSAGFRDWVDYKRREACEAAKHEASELAQRQAAAVAELEEKRDREKREREDAEAAKTTRPITQREIESGRCDQQRVDAMRSRLSALTAALESATWASYRVTGSDLVVATEEGVDESLTNSPTGETLLFASGYTAVNLELRDKHGYEIRPTTLGTLATEAVGGLTLTLALPGSETETTSGSRSGDVDASCWSPS